MSSSAVVRHTLVARTDAALGHRAELQAVCFDTSADPVRLAERRDHHGEQDENAARRIASQAHLERMICTPA